MDTIELQVEETYHEDEGKAIARIDPNTMLELSCMPGDCVLLSGQRKTYAKVWRAKRRDWNDDKILLDDFLSYNAQVEKGDSVDIQLAHLDPIKQISLLPFKGQNINTTRDANQMIKKQLLKRPVHVGAVVPLATTDENQIPMVVTGPATRQPGIITEETKVSMPEGYISD